jgi:ectoine hydroxylase-related dioxygenase (phytanoyl-CoA dioxygenase family)
MSFEKEEVDDWFDRIIARRFLQPSALLTLRSQGFIVMPGPIAHIDLMKLASAYDQAVLQADPSDVRSNSTTRVNDFVNRGADFDNLYLHPPVLEACSEIIGEPFNLSSLLARTLNPQKPAQTLHVDFSSDEKGWPMVGFIFMVDEFRHVNGATCFMPGSQGAKETPEVNGRLVQACGPAGSMIVYNGCIWHGHAANVTEHPRRSIQGAYIRRTEASPVNLPGRMRPETLKWIGPLAKYLLAL